jgi:hypothetical protein
MSNQFFRLLLFLLVAIPASYASAQETVAPSQASDAANPDLRCHGLGSSDTDGDILAKLCGFALSYHRLLPDFIAQQTTTARGAHSSTVMTAQVVFRSGREYYSQLTLNGKPVAHDAAALPRNVRFTSAGEFGSMLVDLFSVPGTAEFKFHKASTLQGLPVAIYEFRVPAEKNFFWTISDTSQRTFQPEFRGQVWLDRTTGRPLREELEPVHLPKDWSVTSIKTVTDYAMTPVKDVGTYLLPTRSESTVCFTNRGLLAGFCNTNTLVFHDYQKFTTTTRILDATQAP